MSERVVVIGAGVAGLAAARALRNSAPDIEIVVLEAQRRCGGLVETVRSPPGFVIEHGADSVVTTKPRGIAAIRAAGLGGEITFRSGSHRTYVAGRDELVPIPSVLSGIGPGALLSLLRSPLLSLAGKARTALEAVVRPRHESDDESVDSFTVRRFGREFSRAVLDPLIGGVHGGETHRLSVDACLPRLRAFEREHGSVTLGMHRAVRARHRRARHGEIVLPPVVTLRRGMGSVPEALARGLAVTTGVAATRVTRERRGFRVETAHDGPLRCDGVVVATPAWQVPSLVEQIAPDLAAELGSIEHRALDCVSLAWRRRDVSHPLDGTGWLRASGDSRATLACTWASEKWPDRAPPDFVLMRSVLRHAARSDEDLVALACADLRDLVGITAPPVFALVRRLPHATPIYALGHLARVARIATLTRELGAFALAGNAYQGVGVPDCMVSGEDAAFGVLGTLGAQRR